MSEEPKKLLEMTQEELLVLGREMVKRLPANFPNIPWDGKTANNGMKCICEGMHPHPECPLHRMIRH